MKTRLLLLLSLVSYSSWSQEAPGNSILDGRNWGLVIDHPDMKKVAIKPDVSYFTDEKVNLKMDVYLPPNVQANEKRPAVIFLNAIGENPGERKVKSWGIYTSWPQYVAANGYVGISMEADGTRIQESIAALFNFIDKNGKNYNIDADRLGVYAASANVSGAGIYIMKPEAYKGIKAAVLYYGSQFAGPYRKDLPVFFVIPESDVRNGYATLWNEVLKNNAPWTIKMCPGLIHGFDAFSDNDDSRKVIKETMAFWKNNLDPAPGKVWPNSIGREILSAQYGHDDAKAETLLKKYLAEKPNDTRALFSYGNLLKNQKRYAEAEPILKKGLSADQSNPYAMADMAVTEYALNKSDEAENYLAQAINSGRMNKYVLANMGIALYGMNRHKEGVRLFEKAVEMNPGSVDYYNLACGYAILHENDKAFASLDKAVAMGFDSKRQVENDTDLESLRSDKRYSELVARLK